MRQRLTLEQIKEMKKQDKCPSCGAELERTTFTEDGEEIEIKLCGKSCGYWGS